MESNGILDSKTVLQDQRDQRPLSLYYPAWEVLWGREVSLETAMEHSTYWSYYLYPQYIPILSVGHLVQSRRLSSRANQKWVINIEEIGGVTILAKDIDWVKYSVNIYSTSFTEKLISHMPLRFWILNGFYVSFF